MPLTALMTLLSTLVMFGAWWIIGMRMKSSDTAASRQVILLRRFFLHMGIFTIFIFLPYIALSINPPLFPVFMAWGYVIGHIFTYIAFIYIGRLVFSLIPRIAGWEKWAVALGVIANIVITAITTVTMVYGVRPEYDTERLVTILNVAPIVGISIAIFAAVTVLPTIILMITNGVRNPSARLRSFLLGGGLLVVMIGGPMHDNATSAGFYIAADIITIVGLAILAGGVLYRFEERFNTVRQTSTTTA